MLRKITTPLGELELSFFLWKALQIRLLDLRITLLANPSPKQPSDVIFRFTILSPFLLCVGWLRCDFDKEWTQSGEERHRKKCFESL